MVLSSPWSFGKREVEGLLIPFLSWHGQDDVTKASVKIYRAPSSVVKDGDGLVVSLSQGVFQCDGAPLTVAMMDGKLFEFSTDGACHNGIIEVHSTQDQANEIWREVQKGSLPSGVRQNSHYLVLHSDEQSELADFQRMNETSVQLGNDSSAWRTFSSEWKFLSTDLKSGAFPTLSYEGLLEDSRVLIQIFRMPTSLARQHGNIMIAMVPEREPFSCNGAPIRITMSDGSFFDLSTTGKCVQGMVEAHSLSSQEGDLWKKIQSNILPQAVGLGDKAYFKLLSDSESGLKQFQQANMAIG
ncbi:hypothetical protein FAI40_00810 [Acetobacteraceae bacterium]|nr:hypothetical protein FAI40_00810 [Acetobacteraceae bacterium]